MDHGVDGEDDALDEGWVSDGGTDGDTDIDGEVEVEVGVGDTDVAEGEVLGDPDVGVAEPVGAAECDGAGPTPRAGLIRSGD